MKRWILLLAVVLMLTGCSKETAPDSNTLPSGDLPQQEQGGLYEPDSALEQQTDGAVKVYPLEKGMYDGLLSTGDDLLLFSEAVTRMTLLTGNNLVSAVTKDLPYTAALDIRQLHREEVGFAYVDAGDGSVVFLSAALHEVSRLKLPEDRIGSAQLSPDWNTVYYCTAGGVRALDMKTGVSRVVTEQSHSGQSVTNILMDGAVLCCELQQEDGTRTMKMIASDNGQVLWEGPALKNFVTAEKNWFLPMDRGTVTELLFGQEDTIQNLWLTESADSITALPECNGVVTTTEDSSGYRLDYYDLDSGKHSASVQLAGIKSIQSICADGAEGALWFLAKNAADGSDMICRWELAKSQTEDQNVYTAPHYTREEPDEDGLKRFHIAVETLEKRYGVKLLLGEAPMAVMPDNYSFETEYLVQAFEKYLPVLEAAMARFPEEFYKTAALATDGDIIHIGLVRSISGDLKQGTLPRMPVIQYWQDGEMYLILPMSEQLEQNFYHGMSHVLETRILSNSTAYYGWNSLNPAGFTYDNNYILNADRDGAKYLDPKNRSFVDTFSMSYAKEDRARILEYACMPGNAELFRSPVMQSKLRTVCDGIRKTFVTDDGDKAFIWEQYLLPE